jgi:hypothetical protein
MSEHAARARAWKVLLAGVLTSCAPTVINGIPSSDGSVVGDAGLLDGSSPDGGSLDAPAIDRASPDAAAIDSGKPLPDAATDDGGVAPDASVDDVVSPSDKPITPDDVVSPTDAPIPTEDVVLPTGDVPVTPTDVSVSSCGVPLQRALSLPSDRAMGTTSGAGRLTAMCAQSGGPEHVYPLHVASRTGVQLAVAAPFDSVLSIRRVCADPSTEVACNDDAPGGNNAFLRRVLDPGDYSVLVDQYGPTTGTGGAYTLDLRSYTPAANAECAAGLALTAGAATMGDTTTGGAASTACLGGAWGPQLFYTVRVPAGQRAVVTATPSGTPAWSAVVRARPSCAATACLSAATSPMAGGAAVARYDNRSASPVDLAVSVASTTGTTGGAFSLSVAFEAAPAAPANAACASARALADGATLTNEDASLASTRLGDVCVAEAQGASLFYRVSVPSRATALVTATPRGGWNAVLRALDACDSRTCAASSNAAAADQPETLTWVNGGAVARDVLVAVGSQDPSNGGRFDVTAAIIPAPGNVSCAAAVAVANGAHLTRQNAAVASDNATGACLPSATGTALWYRAVVPAAQTLSVRATPLGAMDPVVRVLSACGATSCLASANTGAARATESAAYTNTSAGDQTVLLAVGGATNAANGLFDLDVSIARQYQESVVPTACDDMTGGVDLAGVTGDDTVSAALDLPFPVTFFGQRMLEYSVSSNGLLQLHPLIAGAMPSNSFSNVAIPDRAVPNGFIAAFWDDLIAVTSSRVVTRTLGAAPDRRFVVQWTQFAFYGDDRARLTFQAKLFEGSGAIEVHHCAITAGADAMRATGGSATVGIESLDGSAGRQHSFDDATGISTARAMRFVP